MKIRFPTSDSKKFLDNRQVPTYFAFDTNELAAWRLPNSQELELWFKGISDSVYLTERELGTENFAALLGILGSEFPHISDVKLPDQ